VATRALSVRAASGPKAAAAPRVRGGIPNGLTLIGLALGFLAALAAGTGGPGQALQLLALAAMADLFAGWTAQGLNQATPIGAELDSLASLIVWGVAVALLAYTQGLESFGRTGTLMAGLVAAVAAWRLCRGDSQHARRHYDGLPLPAAGVILASASALGAPAAALLILIPVLALAQVGPWTYPRLKPGLVRLAPVLLCLGLAAIGWRAAWLIPGGAAALYAAGAPFFVRRGPV
jgi:CDP-diacylglycerol--serine O-phosphatidyltransferase